MKILKILILLFTINTYTQNLEKENLINLDGKQFSLSEVDLKFSLSEVASKFSSKTTKTPISANKLFKSFIKINLIEIDTNRIGDYNKNGIKDAFARVKLENPGYHNVDYYGILEFVNEKLNIICYVPNFKYFYENENLQIKNDTIIYDRILKHKEWGKLEAVSYSFTIDSINNQRYSANKCNINEMENTNILKELDSVRRLKGVNIYGDVKFIEEYREKHQPDNDGKLKITTEISGCNYFDLRFHYMISYQKSRWRSLSGEGYKSLEFAKKHTRYKSIFTRIEKELKRKIENGEGYNINGFMVYRGRINDKKDFFECRIEKSNQSAQIIIKYYIKK